jgi:PDZ domain
MRLLAGLVILAVLVNAPLGAARGDQPQATVATSESQTIRMLAMRLSPRGRGIYSIENSASWNVLDAVDFDPATHRFALIGHRDERFHTAHLPYLQLLAELLEASAPPEFTLTMTPDSSARVDQFFNTPMSQAEGDALAAKWGQWIDPSTGLVSDVGRYMLPAFGVSPIANGGIPGALGIELQSGTTPVRISGVAPNSPADAAGIVAGDVILSMDGVPAYYPEEFTRRVRFAGAGAVVHLQYETAEGKVSTPAITLGVSADGNPWAGTTSFTVMSTIYRNAGNSDAANLMMTIGNYDEVAVQNRYPQLAQVAIVSFVTAAGLLPEATNIRAQIQSGQTSLFAGQRQLEFDLAQRMETIFALPAGSLTGPFDAEVQRSQNLVTAFGVVFGALRSTLEPALGQILDGLAYRSEGVLIPPELVEAEFGVKPEVVPEYFGVPATSQLARIMFFGDYTGKRLIAQPELAKSVPGYITSFAFERAHPQFARTEAAYRLWISVAKMDARQSTDGHTLSFHDVAMRFNIRELANGRDLPPQPGSYESLLTSLYDPLSEKFLALYELKEAAKLAAVARWIHLRDPAFRLPQEGRVAWQGPTQVPGLMYFYLYGEPGSEHSHLKMIATGGVSLTPFPPGNVTANPFAQDSSVVDLTQSSLVAPAQVQDVSEDTVTMSGGGSARTVPQNVALRRIAAHHICVPSPIAPAFIGEATRGTTALESISVAENTLRNSPEQVESADDVQGELEQARVLARQLQITERALNVLNGSLASSATGLASLQSQLRRDRDTFIRDAGASIEQTSDDLRQELALTDGLTASARSFLDNLSQSKTISDLHEFLARLQDARGLSPEAVEKLPDGFTLDFIKEAAEQEFEESANGQFNSREFLDSIGDFKILESVWKVEEDYAKLTLISEYRVDQFTTQGEAARKALHDKLLPLYRQQSDELNAILSEPAIKVLLPAPRASGGCG